MPHSRSVFFTTFVIRTSKPAGPELASNLEANACAAAKPALAQFAGAVIGSIFGSSSGPTRQAGSAEHARNETADTAAATLSSSVHEQPNVSAFSPNDIGKNPARPLVIAALGAAIILLGLAALPATAIRDPRLTEMVVRHRPEVAMAGGAALAAAIVTLAFG